MLNYETDDRRDRGVEQATAVRNSRRCRWTCPICGDSRASISTGEDGDDFLEERAKTALLAHVRASVGGAHGRRHTVPDDFRHDRLDRYVEIEAESR